MDQALAPALTDNAEPDCRSVGVASLSGNGRIPPLLRAEVSLSSRECIPARQTTPAFKTNTNADHLGLLKARMVRV